MIAAPRADKFIAPARQRCVLEEGIVPAGWCFNDGQAGRQFPKRDARNDWIIGGNEDGRLDAVECLVSQVVGIEIGSSVSEFRMIADEIVGERAD